MFDLSPEALTEGPLHHREKGELEARGTNPEVEVGDLEAVGASGTKTENIQSDKT